MNERIQQTCVEASPWLRVVAGAKFSGAFVCDCYESGGAWHAWHHATAPPPPESPLRSFKQSSTHSTLVTQQIKSFVTNTFRAPTFLYKRLKCTQFFFTISCPRLIELTAHFTAPQMTLPTNLTTENRAHQAGDEEEFIGQCRLRHAELLNGDVKIHYVECGNLDGDLVSEYSAWWAQIPLFVLPATLP